MRLPYFSYDSKNVETKLISKRNESNFYCNFPGIGPASDPLPFHTMGTSPKGPPEDVEVQQDGADITVSWNSIVGTKTDDEEPIEGVKVRQESLKSL